MFQWDFSSLCFKWQSLRYSKILVWIWPTRDNLLTSQEKPTLATWRLGGETRPHPESKQQAYESDNPQRTYAKRVLRENNRSFLGAHGLMLLLNSSSNSWKVQFYKKVRKCVATRVHCRNDGQSSDRRIRLKNSRNSTRWLIKTKIDEVCAWKRKSHSLDARYQYSSLFDHARWRSICFKSFFGQRASQTLL